MNSTVSMRTPARIQTLSFGTIVGVLVTLLALFPVFGAVFTVAFAASAQTPMANDVTPSPAGASLEIISPADGAKLSSPLTVKFGLAGMGVAPAGIAKENTGHHHLIVDAPLPNTDYAIPSNDKHRHFGGGQTQVTLELEPGEHTLQLLLGDYRHIPHDKPITSKKITITVK